ncbi:amidohydrolase 2 [Candidatus Magnetobacterium bavaricum]|uniref:Amidohydrolase 2 n=1 Tax=Candidatus Magnetobacterium bavaricum TaxID=29290 RepID=A0A0F3GQI8_9BACT|nr:amidohydrolase 2 [Candidatus Magnetobacterium bavaricum]
MAILPVTYGGIRRIFQARRRFSMKRIDMHCHIVGNGEDVNRVDDDVYFKPEDNQHFVVWGVYKTLEVYLRGLGFNIGLDGKVPAGDYLHILYNFLKNSKEIDAIVLLALDALWSPDDGGLDVRKTDLYVSNRYVNRTVRELNDHFRREKSDKRFLLGASVSPNRNDWEKELRFVLDETDAVLIKWIPSVQHITVDDEKHKPFYKMLAEHKMPLLCHIGPEYSFPEGLRNLKLDVVEKLETPLNCGVTVIAAHCGTPVLSLIDQDHTEELLKLMQKKNSDQKVCLWADTSALSLSTRVHLIDDIAKTFPAKWLLHGSDFPVPIETWPHLLSFRSLGDLDESRKLLNTTNPFDQDVRIKRLHKFDDQILSNAEKVLRITNTAFD